MASAAAKRKPNPTGNTKPDKYLLRLHGISKQLVIILPKLNLASHTINQCKSNETNQKYLRSFGITHEVNILICKLKREDEDEEQPIQSKMPTEKCNNIPKKLSCSNSKRKSFKMKTRIKVPSSQKLAKCDLCDKTYTSKGHLYRHLREVHKFEPATYHCSHLHCNFKGFSINSVQYHLAKVHEESPFKCSNCDRSFKTKTDVERHMQKHSEVKQFKCDYENCNYRSTEKGNLKVHTNTHLPSEQKPYRCNFDLCQFSFSARSNLNRHVLLKHTPELIIKKHKCEFCEYKTRYRSELEMHVRCHTSEKSFACNFCKYTTKRSNKLVIHMRIHTGEKPFSCSVCQKTFTEAYTLTVHMRIHTGEKPFSCVQCDYKTAYKRSLQVHIAIKHENQKRERSFLCSFCTKAFYDQTHLNDHYRTHTKEKPFICKWCKKQYSCCSSFKIHKMKHAEEI